MNRLRQETWRAWRESPCERTFEPFYEETKALLWTLCKRVLHDEEDAFDAFQSAYGRLLADPSALPKAGEPAEMAVRFLSRTAIREADALRKRRGRAQKRIEGGLDDAALERHAGASTGSALETVERSQMKEKLETIMEMLEENYRVPVLLHYFDGMTHQEIADALGAPVKTISTRISRALRRLEPAMRAAGFGEGIAGVGILAGASSLAMPPASATAAAVFTGAQSIAVGIGAGGIAAGASGGVLGGKLAAATAWLGTKAGIFTSGMAVGAMVLLAVAFRPEPPKPPETAGISGRAVVLAQAAAPTTQTENPASSDSGASDAPSRANATAPEPSAPAGGAKSEASSGGASDSSGGDSVNTSTATPKLGLIVSATSNDVLNSMTDRVMVSGGGYYMLHRMLISSVKASGVDLHIIVEPGTQENAEIKMLLESQRMTEKVIQGDDKESLRQLDSIIGIYAAGLPDDMLMNIMEVVKGGVGFGTLGDFCSIKPGPSAELNEFVGMKQDKGLYRNYQQPMNLRIVAPQEMLIGYFGTIQEYPITIASGYTGMVEGTPLLELPPEIDPDFCPMYMREYGKGRMMVVQMIYDPMNASAMMHVVTLSRYVVNWISRRPLDSNWTRKAATAQIASATATPAVSSNPVAPSQRLKVGLIVSKLSRVRITGKEIQYDTGQEDITNPDDKRISPKVILGIMVAGRLQFLKLELRAVIEPEARTDKRVVEFLEAAGLDQDPIDGSSAEELKEVDVVLAYDCAFMDGAVLNAITEAVRSGGVGFLAVGKIGVANEADRPALKGLIGAENRPDTLQIVPADFYGNVPDESPLAAYLPAKLRKNVPLTILYCYDQQPDGLPALVIQGLQGGCSGSNPVYLREMGEGRVLVAATLNVGVRGMPQVVDGDTDPGVSYFRAALNWLADMPPVSETEAKNEAGAPSVGAKTDAQICQENLTKLDGAKEQWAFEHDKKVGDSPTREILVPQNGESYLFYFPVCPSGGEYVIGPIGTNPRCTSGLPGHSLESVSQEIPSPK